MIAFGDHHYDRKSMSLSPGSQGPKPTPVQPPAPPPSGGETLHDGAAAQDTSINETKKPARQSPEQVLLVVVRPNGTLELFSPAPESAEFHLMRMFVAFAAERPEETKFEFNLKKERGLKLLCVDQFGKPLNADVQQYGSISFQRKGATFEVTELKTPKRIPAPIEEIVRAVAPKIIHQLEQDKRRRPVILSEIATGYTAIGIDPKSEKAAILEGELKNAFASEVTGRLMQQSPQSSEVKPTPSWAIRIDGLISLIASFGSKAPHLDAVILMYSSNDPRFHDLSVDPLFERFLDSLSEPVPLLKRFLPEGQRKTVLAKFIKDLHSK